MVNERQFRATFEDVKKKQRMFRHKLDILIKDNRPLTPTERDQMFDLYADANFGLGTLETVIWLSDAKTIRVPNFEKFVRDLFYWDNKIVNGTFFFKSLGPAYKKYTVEIKELWEQIRSKINGIDPEALAMSVRISKEQKSSKGSRSSYVGPKNKSRFTG